MQFYFAFLMEKFWENVKIDLQLIDINVDKIQKALHGVALELEDCAFPY